MAYAGNSSMLRVSKILIQGRIVATGLDVKIKAGQQRVVKSLWLYLLVYPSSQTTWPGSSTF